MKRMLKNLLLERLLDDEEAPTPASFDDLLVRELREPSVEEDAPAGASDIAPSGGLTVDLTPDVIVDSTPHENDLLRAELLPRKQVDPVEAGGHRPVFNETGRLTPETMFEQPPAMTALSQPPALPQTPALAQPPALTQAPAPPPWAAPQEPATDQQPQEQSPDHAGSPVQTAPNPGQALTYGDTHQQPEPAVGLQTEIDLQAEPAAPAVGAPAVGSPDGLQANRTVQRPRSVDFWHRYDEANAAANLFSVPPSAITVVIGPLEVSISVAKRCSSRHWVGECDVFVLTERPEVPGEPDWKILRRPSDVVQVLEDGESDFPLIVLDIERDLPAWVRPLVARLRQSGVGLVHYVLDDEPSDEDLATWFGELGRPSVLDLAAYVPPSRVTALLDRGEPIASVAGKPISTDLLLALRLGGE